MDTGPSEEEYLRACLHGIDDDRAQVVRAMIDAYAAECRMNRAKETAHFRSLLRDINEMQAAGRKHA